VYIVDNRTAYVADAFPLPDRNGDTAMVTVIKVTYTFAADGTIRLSDTQVPLCDGDDYYGEPGLSGVRYTTDRVFAKHGTDIAVNGHVYAPMGDPVKKLRASLTVGSLKKNVDVWGDRFWMTTLGFVSRTSPIPFARMAIGYDRVFGGTDTTHTDPAKQGLCPENPAGTGYRVRAGKRSISGLALPNFERPETPIRNWADKPSPAGLGCIPPVWEPRKSFGGTCDARWREERMPLPPVDFDIRFNNAAAPDLITDKALTGRETVILKNFHPRRGTVRFKLPGLTIRTAYIFEHQTFKPRPVPDTLIIEPDEDRFILVYRSHYSGRLPWTQLKQVTIREENRADNA
jgi:hypothetical protein